MPRHRALLALVAALLAANATAVTVKLTQADGARVQVELHPGDVLRVELPSEPAGGKRWSLRGHVPPLLTELGASQRVFGGRMSDQGASSFAWRAAATGEGTIRLEYGTPSLLQQQQPQKSVTVQVTITGAPLGPEEAHPAALSQLEQVDSYQRTGRCGDCSALVDHLVLYRAPDESPYVLRSTYKDAPGGTLTRVTTGLWQVHHGSYADPAATLYLLSASSDAPSALQVEGDRLAPLDAQQIPVPSPPGMDNAFHKAPAP